MVCSECKEEKLVDNDKKSCPPGWIEVYCSHEKQHNKCICKKCADKPGVLIHILEIDN
jgi:hypothetical protein